MSTQGNNALTKGIPKLEDAFVVIVKTEWNATLIDQLASGCERVFKENNVDFETVIVPGAVELPFAVKAWNRSSQRKPDAYIVFGIVIRGATPHFDYVCKIVSEGVLDLNMTLDVPTVFGVLTVENEEQVLERVGGKDGHKGEEAAITAIKMIDYNRRIK
ncbi:MAG: 6,7-dimethyl-8-ribityllumazine synthase [Pseudopedobacter saltans]|uniref:6,7-dimethyl-8-ribityllumazine synthase n=1 Tax=Pseudopedobacter saltans TaxID=151895 RepID=A0A2W5H412_9SPHI|nr:MAG: 6,7-dimethyl-8-ribityllumazine synthase [Pseudopedobacter saltans]